ncbi:Hypothetical protein R9X50_00623300 [Acrodontium crateriforme]|uniref:BTB domain-containing protein n=1 Tax=Acrodontium crateriforme TaxID=150365 RepID=A0AAQ3M8I8_9PEZI|nr:Hypothetical protein R9X50_00623300 [Acrodontium crateriforme]
MSLRSVSNQPAISPGGKDSPVDSAAPSTPSASGEDEIIVIAKEGDIVLHIEHDIGERQSACRLRVSSRKLADVSKYFARLLQPGRFGEGERVDTELKSLREKYPSIAEAPATELPVISLQDLGRISTVKSISPLCTDMLYMLHGNDLAATPPLTNLANLAIVADRFDALIAAAEYANRKKLIRTIDGKTTPKIDTNLTQEKVRQRLLVAVLFNYSPWIEKYSARLIIRGWVGNEVETTLPLWWDLPSRFEEELLCRREYMLDAVQSVQAHFLSLYSSRERQCKLGYDSSAQCDSFQLGEMIRFFMRIGTLKLQGVVYDATEPPEPYSGDVYSLLDAMQQVPEYQIDKNHHHCGIRTRIIPLIDTLRESISHIGICFEYWTTSWSQYAWMEAKQPLLWRKQNYRLKATSHETLHANVRGLFMAAERDWSI